MSERNELQTNQPHMTDLSMMIEPMMKVMAQMASTLSSVQLEMEAMRKDIMREMPLKSSQARHLNAAIRERAQAVRGSYALPEEAEKEAMKEIRKKLCRTWGCNAVSGIPQMDYALALEIVTNWDEQSLVRRYI